MDCSEFVKLEKLDDDANFEQYVDTPDIINLKSEIKQEHLEDELQHNQMVNFENNYIKQDVSEIPEVVPIKQEVNEGADDMADVTQFLHKDIEDQEEINKMLDNNAVETGIKIEDNDLIAGIKFKPPKFCYRRKIERNDIYVCEFCSFKTKYVSNLKMHIKCMHTKPEIYECDQCSYRSANQRNFKSHVNRVHVKSYTHVCHLCDHATTCKENLKFHIRNKHEGRPNRLKCDQCSFDTSSKHTFKKHMVNKHGGNIDELESKYRSEPVKECEFCDYTTPYKSSLDQHIIRKHSGGEKRLKCDFCDHSSFFYFELKRHINRKHTKSEHHQCPHCEYSTVDKADLRSHVSRRHKDKTSKLSKDKDIA